MGVSSVVCAVQPHLSLTKEVMLSIIKRPKSVAEVTETDQRRSDKYQRYLHFNLGTVRLGGRAKEMPWTIFERRTLAATPEYPSVVSRIRSHERER